MNTNIAVIVLVLIALAGGAYWYVTDRNAQEPVVPGEVTPPVTEDTVAVQLYYYNPANDQGPGGVQCTAAGLVAVEREVQRTITPIQDAIRLLLEGELTVEERAQGITTEFPLDGFSLEAASLTDGALTLTFNDPQNSTVGGSCRASVLWRQIEATALQFPEVDSVQFAPEDLFQP